MGRWTRSLEAGTFSLAFHLGPSVSTTEAWEQDKNALPASMLGAPLCPQGSSPLTQVGPSLCSLPAKHWHLRAALQAPKLNVAAGGLFCWAPLTLVAVPPSPVPRRQPLKASVPPSRVTKRSESPSFRVSLIHEKPEVGVACFVCIKLPLETV